MKALALSAALVVGVAEGRHDLLSAVLPRPPMERIVGGDPVNGNWKYPSFTQLLNGDKPYCGGNLISSEWVLTAAHCIEPSKPVSFYNLRLFDDFESTVLNRKVSQVVVHPDYTSTGFSNDLAVSNSRAVSSRTRQARAVPCRPN
jgi:secreted trypsin-like serine protease